MHLLDTPGVLPPKIESVETGMKLALCGEQNRIIIITIIIIIIIIIIHHNVYCHLSL